MHVSAASLAPDSSVRKATPSDNTERTARSGAVVETIFLSRPRRAQCSLRVILEIHYRSTQESKLNWDQMASRNRIRGTVFFFIRRDYEIIRGGGLLNIWTMVTFWWGEVLAFMRKEKGARFTGLGMFYFYLVLNPRNCACAAWLT